jgi:aspartate kinase
VSKVAAALAERGIALGAAVPRVGGLLEFTAPGVGAPEATAALDAMEIPAKVDEDLGSIAVVGLGIGRRPGIIARSLAALRTAGIAPRLVTTMPGRVSVLVDADLLEEAVRVLHATFIPVAPDPRLMAGRAA